MSYHSNKSHTSCISTYTVYLLKSCLEWGMHLEKITSTHYPQHASAFLHWLIHSFKYLLSSHVPDTLFASPTTFPFFHVAQLKFSPKHLLLPHMAQLKRNWFKAILILFPSRRIDFMKRVNPNTGQWKLKGSLLWGAIWKGLFALKSCTRKKLSVIVLCVNLGRLW